MPNKRVIIFESSKYGVKAAFWLDVPAGRERQYADPNKGSAWSGADALELAALRGGSVVEVVNGISADLAGPERDMQNLLEDRWRSLQADLRRIDHTRALEGTFWAGDGSGWTVVRTP